MKDILSIARLPARDPQEPHRAATQLELFFDLISVVAIASVTAGLHHAISEGHGLEKLPVFIFLFFAIWWAWMNFTWFASAFDNGRPVFRMLVMIIMTGEVIFAGGAAHIFETLDLGWGVAGWTLMRLAMAALWLRASANTDYRATALRYAAGIIIGQAYWIGFYFLVPAEPALFFGFGVFGFVLELAVPPIAERAGRTPFHRHHMIERYGLLMIIILGEIILAISMGFGGLYDEHANLAAIPTTLSGLIIVFALFWIYFCEDEHLPSSDFKTAFVWGYGHIFVFAAVAILGAAIAAELDLSTDHSHVTQAVISWWFGAPLALFFLALWLVRDRHFKLDRRAWSLPAGVVLSLAAASAGLASWAFAAIVFLTVLWRAPMSASAPAHRPE
ncbi:low temperature requirement protein A [Hyphococcus sp.]|uniref:low temperature requirement protein A n=1 Tax=Hyphococcus sp. TaxID=2038636 RepID=UPI00208C1FA7|nr:MAG: membrane protein [Marinicaulis sp.]